MLHCLQSQKVGHRVYRTRCPINRKGWERGTTNAFTWRIAIAKTESATTGVQADLVFDTRGNPRVTINALPVSGADAVLLCGAASDLDNLAVSVSGRTISFSGRIGGAGEDGLASGCADTFAAFDPDTETNDDETNTGVRVGDDLEFELTLDSLPMTDAVALADVKAQKIKFSGKVTISHVAKADTGDDAEDDSTKALTASYDFTGEATYTPPGIQPASN